tara:strand:- start:646 stop:2160 length:1515 start_codon:yes stop_codon:yes gene_type:complete
MIIMGEEAREKMLEGINLTADAVKPTLGPMSRTVVLKERGKPIIVNDGVTVAKAIYHEDEFVDMGAKLLIEVATQAQNLAGDGTTTACVLAQSFCERGMELIKEGTNPVNVADDLKQLVDEISTNLLNSAKPIQNSNEIKNVATIAANNDKIIGGLIAEAIETVGESGVITVSESKDMNTSIEVVQGIEIDRGYRSHHLAIDKEKNQTEMIDPLLLISNFQIVRFQELVPILEKVAEQKRPLLLISRALEQHAITNLIVNVMGGMVQCCAIESPDYGHISDALLEDIAILTGGKFLDYQTDDKLEEVTIDDLGTAEKVTVGEAKTLIVNGAGDKEIIQERAKMIEGHFDLAKNDFQLDKMKTRVAKILGGVAVLHVGAASEVEMRDKMERVDDALNATRAAMELGIIKGGGYELASIETDSPFKESLTKPYYQILKNAGITTDVLIPLNAKTGEQVDLFEEGIIDPVKVTLSSLNSAASVAALVLTSEVLVGEKEDAVHSQGMF